MRLFPTMIVIAVFAITFSFIKTVRGQEKKGIVFRNEILSLGKLSLHESKEVFFAFTNYSNSPIVILNANVNCNCTTLSYPKTPIKHFQNDSIKVVFKAESKGVFSKNITVFFSDKTKKKISIVGTVAE